MAENRGAKREDLAALAEIGLLPKASVLKLSALGIRAVPDLLGAFEASPEAVRQVAGWSEERCSRLMEVMRRRMGGEGLCAARHPGIAPFFPMGCQDELEDGLVTTTQTIHPVLAQARRMVEVEGLPESVEHPSSEIRTQLENSCVGQAKTSFLEPYCGHSLSALFLYRLAQREDGLEGDVGSRPMTAAKILKQTGCCMTGSFPKPEHRELPYADLPDPDERACAEAARFKIADFVPLNSLEDVLAILAFGNGQGMRVPIGIRMFQSSVGNPQVARTGNLLERLGARDRHVGNHEVLLTGYDCKTNRFRFQNSWGPAWGCGGCGTLSFKYFREHAVSAIMLVPEPTYSKPLRRVHDTGVALQHIGTSMAAAVAKAWPFVVMAVSAAALFGLFWPLARELPRVHAMESVVPTEISETAQVDSPQSVELERPAGERQTVKAHRPSASLPSRNIYVNLLGEIEQIAVDYPEMIPDLIEMREDFATRGREWMKQDELRRTAKNLE
ncbi:MAG: hypothetical protein JJU00_20175 [Opitutales bacterium]|nr:hypothetical protein [Opitutales bacterium]